jgi:hypothetical protein
MRVLHCKVRLTEAIQVTDLVSGKIERSAEALREKLSPDFFPLHIIKIIVYRAPSVLGYFWLYTR